VVRTTFLRETVRAPGDAHPRHRVDRLIDGRILFYTGDGTAAPTLRFGTDAENRLRAYGDLRVDGAALSGASDRFLTESVPPFTYRNTKRLIGPVSRWNARTSPQRVSVPANGYLQVSGIHQHADIIAGNGAWIDCIHMPKGATVNIIPQSSSAVYHLYTGEGEWSGSGSSPATLTPNSWANTGGKLLTTSAGAWVRVRRGNNSFLAVADSGSVVAAIPVGEPGGVAMPAADLVVGFGPQSWGVDLRMQAAAAWAAAAAALGLPSKVYSPDTANVGASSLLYFAAKSTLYYWNPDGDTPGQRLTDMIEAIKADRTARTALQGSTAPAMTDFVWFEGLNLMGLWGPSGDFPLNNPAVYTASFVKLCQHMDAELGYPLRHWIIPLTSQKFGTFPIAGSGMPNGWHAVRMAQARCPAAGADASPAVAIHLAPEVYGDPRSQDDEGEEGERHYDYPVQELQAIRLCQAHANVVHGQTNHLGPGVVSVSTADAGAGIVWDVLIDYGNGRAFNSATRPQDAGFALLPAATGDIDVDDFATPLTIASTRWAGGIPETTTVTLRVTLAAAYLAGTPRASVLWGAAEATDELSSVIFTVDPVTGRRAYLRTHLSGG